MERTQFKVVLEGCCRCPDSHDLSLRPLLATENLLPPIGWTALTLTPKNYSWKPSGTTLNFAVILHTKSKKIIILKNCLVITVYLGKLKWLTLCSFRGRPEISTFSTYEITSHKRGEGVPKNVDNLITFWQHINYWQKCTVPCKNECHHIWWLAILRSIVDDSSNWLRQITLPWKM